MFTSNIPATSMKPRIANVWTFWSGLPRPWQMFPPFANVYSLPRTIKTPIIARSNGFASNKLRVWGCFTPPIWGFWGHIGHGLITPQNEQWQNWPNWLVLSNFGAPPVSFESLPSCTWSMPSDFKVETRRESKRSIVSRFYTDMGPIFRTESDRETNLHGHHSFKRCRAKKGAHQLMIFAPFASIPMIQMIARYLKQALSQTFPSETRETWWKKTILYNIYI